MGTFLNYSLQPEYKISGNRANMLQMMYYLDQLTITTKWSLSYSGPPTYYSYSNLTTDFKNPQPIAGIPYTKADGYYYDISGTVRPDPSSKVLMTFASIRSLPAPGIDNAGGVSLGQQVTMDFRPTFDGSAFKVALNFLVTAVDTPVGTSGPYRFVATTDSSLGPTVATTNLLLNGMSFPIYLVFEGPFTPLVTFTEPFSVTATSTFFTV